MSTVNEHHFGAVFKDQVSDSTVGQSDSHQVLALQRQNLYKQNHLSTSLIKTHCRTILPNFNQKGTKDKNICVLLFGLQSKVSVTVFVSERTRTCTWSSSVTGSEVLVDLSAIRFLLTAIRGLALERSTQNNRVQG